MGKVIAFAVVGTLVFVMLKQESSTSAQVQTDDTKIGYQEDFLAQEIATSAFSILERRVESIGGPVDSLVAAINGYSGSVPNINGYTEGDFQGGSYEISVIPTAADDVVELRAKGMYGDESHELMKFFTATPAIPDTDWEYGCNSSQGPNFVEIQGLGMGDQGILLNDGGTIVLADTHQVFFLKAQVGGRTGNINTVNFTSLAGEDTTLTAPTASGEHTMGYFEAPMQSTSAVTVDVDVDPNNGARGFVVYAHRRIPGSHFSEGRYMDVRMYHNTHTETFDIPPASNPRDVHVDFVMYDKDDDGRTVTMTVEADGEIESRTIGMPNPERELAIETVTIQDVPGHVTEILVSIDTNDSLYWKMAHLHTAGCP